ncbi:JmjC domain-containing protein D, partial [Trifolium pratense]
MGGSKCSQVITSSQMNLPICGCREIMRMYVAGTVITKLQFSFSSSNLKFKIPSNFKQAMEECIKIRRYEEFLTDKDFESLIEAKNVPAVLCGCIKNWRAFSLWNPRNDGLNYLQERVGSCVVEAMVSSSAPVFYGDLGSHQRVPLPFSTFIDLCKKRMHMQTEQQQHLDGDHCVASQTDHTQHDFSSLEDVPDQIYLAQVSIMNNDRQEKVQLGTLMEDIQTPPILGAKELSSINLWMNNAQSRSSTHYDPHQNLLCIVSGRKQVVLWPPSASPSLYPMPIYGEASNHSSVALENPDYSIYPRAECSMEFGQKVVLEAGDALFIPEG